jgi:hypothetical protein
MKRVVIIRSLALSVEEGNKFITNCLTVLYLCVLCLRGGNIFDDLGPRKSYAPAKTRMTRETGDRRSRLRPLS